MSQNTNGPLSPYTVLDLTRARSGPTCVRQLADLGASVIQVAAREDEDGRLLAPRLRLAEPAPQQALDDPRPQGAARASRSSRSSAAKADVVVENFRPDVKHAPRHRLRDAVARSIRGSSTAASRASARPAPTATARATTRSRRAWAGSCRSPACPARGRCASASRWPTSPPGIFLAQGILAALIERERSGRGQWVHTSLLAGDGDHARLPGRALAHRRRDPAPGRQRPPDRHPHRRLQDQGRPHQHRGLRPAHVPAPLRGARHRGAARRPALPDGAGPLEEPHGARRSSSSSALVGRTSAEWVELLNAKGVPVGPDPERQAGVRERADPRTWSMAVPVKHPALGELRAPGAAVHAVAHARRRSARPRPTSASTPTRSWASSATPPTTSRACAATRSSSAGTGSARAPSLVTADPRQLGALVAANPRLCSPA